MNNAIRIPTPLMIAALCIAGFVYAERAASAIPSFDSDGWYTWRVAAVDGLTRCCANWNAGRVESWGCNLDTDESIAGCSNPEASDEVQVYVRVEGGEITAIRAFSPSCPVETETELRDLGRIANGDSVARLGNSVSPTGELSEAAFAAISAHAGAEAFAFLRNVVRDEQDIRIREQALFWLVQTNTDEAFDFVERIITAR